MKPFWVTVVARPAVGLLAREVHAEMTALFAVTAAPAPGTDLVRTNNQDAAYAGRRLFAAGQAATAAGPGRCVYAMPTWSRRTAHGPPPGQRRSDREVAPARRRGT